MFKRSVLSANIIKVNRAMIVLKVFNFRIWGGFSICTGGVLLSSQGDCFQIFYLFIYLYFCVCWVFVAVRGLSLVAVSRGYYSLRCVGFSLWWLLLLQSMGSRSTGFSSCGLWALECRLSSCGARA